MKYSNVYKIKKQRCEMMEYIKIALYIGITFNHFYWGCGNMKKNRKRSKYK